ncbi:hypothetical protein [Paenibacillus tyrfis]|uniref:Uncharacterized protein n=1 Tax=Paenibacillus tyrfis TaxID=1501230 RepID=A0A081NY95_9BACL|nr:hypothetical protein [Paenibacillus tyrfis]KEQ23418.1 hypothetical protein ET33_16430 [Paenibacillus tyrfis]
MNQLPTGALITVISVLGSILLTLASIIGYFLKDIRNSVKENQSAQDKHIQNIERDVSELKAELPQKYVLKDDFNRALKELKDDQTRAIAGLEHKVDTLTRDVREMLQNVSKIMGTGGKSE